MKYPPALAIATLALLLAAPAQAADIVWAIAGPFTGGVASWGLSQQAGAKQAAADINAAGGIGGRKIALKFYDDNCDPKQAVAVANKIVSDNIRFALHSTCSSAALAALKTYDDEGILVMNAMSSNPDVTDRGGPDMFRAMYRDDKNADIIADMIEKKFANKKLAILNDKSAYGLGIAEGLRKRLNAAGIHEAMFETYDPGNHDYAVLVTRLKRLGAEAVMIGGYPVEVGLIARQMREAGMTAQIIGGDLSAPDFWRVTGAAGEGTLFAFASDPRKLPSAQPVLARLEKSGVVVDGYTLYEYAAAQALAQAMTQAKSDDPAKVAAELHKGSFDTILGSWKFDAKGDVENIRLVPYRWHDGQFMEVTE